MLMGQTQARAADNICERVKIILSDRLGMDEDQIQLSDNLREDLGADSLDLIEVVIALAQEFGRDVFDENARKIQTAGELVTYIEQRYALETPWPQAIGEGSVLDQLPCLKVHSDSVT